MGLWEGQDSPSVRIRCPSYRTRTGESYTFRVNVGRHDVGTCPEDVERDDEDGRERATPGIFGKFRLQLGYVVLAVLSFL
jgi:hypothetical protein